MSMTRRTGALVLLLVLHFSGLGLNAGPERSVAAAEDPHAYFNTLVRRNDHWKSYSFRDPAQLASVREGGYREGTFPWVSYDRAADKDPHRQDAAKVVIPAFHDTGRAALARPISAATSVLTLVAAREADFPRNRVIMIDREIMTVTEWLSDTTIAVERGTHGTSAATHVAGAAVMHATNSLRSQVRVPLGTEDGHDYFFVWDSYWTDSFVGAGRFNHKAFQFSSGGRKGNGLWLEPGVRFQGTRRATCWDPSVHVGSLRVRLYNKSGGDADWSLSDGNRLGPGAGPAADYCILPNTWTRFFLRLGQRANDYDIVDMWVADEMRDAVQVLTSASVSVRPTGAMPNTVASFWIEFNSSNDKLLRADRRDLVAYVRNFVALRDAGNPEGLLVRPVPGAEPGPSPSPPRNVRFVR